MSTVTGVITQVLDRWPAGSSWMVEVEVFAYGRYHHADIPAFTERDAKAIQRGDQVTVTTTPDDDSDSLDEIPF
ncbi:hypothetical protein [Enterobacter ludwigii]|uniref:hypothetical protein n=1 Tax=Enterobacter ludwigii TaxID=299767 RepID=UPI0018674EC4|nr:hypothetical protein [Enterobacter ludwigii]